MTEPRPYNIKPIIVEAVRLDGYGAFLRAASWIKSHSVRSRVSSGTTSDDMPYDVLLIDTPTGTTEALEDWFVVRTGNVFRAYAPEDFHKQFDAVPVSDMVPTLPEAQKLVPRTTRKAGGATVD